MDTIERMKTLPTELISIIFRHHARAWNRANNQNWVEYARQYLKRQLSDGKEKSGPECSSYDFIFNANGIRIEHGWRSSAYQVAYRRTITVMTPGARSYFHINERLESDGFKLTLRMIGPKETSPNRRKQHLSYNTGMSKQAIRFAEHIFPKKDRYKPDCFASFRGSCMDDYMEFFLACLTMYDHEMPELEEYLARTEYERPLVLNCVTN